MFYFWHKNRKIFLYLMIGTIVCLASLLLFGNPQANKWIFIFQHYIFPRYRLPGEFVILDDELSHELKRRHFSGIMRYWHANGQLGFQVPYKDGVKSGQSLAFYNSGMLYFTRTYVRDFPFGIAYEWNVNGDILSICGYYHDYVISYYFTWNDDSVVISAQYSCGPNHFATRGDFLVFTKDDSNVDNLINAIEFLVDSQVSHSAIKIDRQYKLDSESEK